jgi:coenzyme PQQ precursor peptide PqqA
MIISRSVRQGSEAMRKWKTPQVVEIAVGMEINCYACATA